MSASHRYVAWSRAVGRCSHRHKSVRTAVECAMRFNRGLVGNLITERDHKRWQRRAFRFFVNDNAMLPLTNDEQRIEELTYCQTVEPGGRRR